jgi:hypothetical protein
VFCIHIDIIRHTLTPHPQKKIKIDQSQLKICLVVEDQRDCVKIVTKITMIGEIQVHAERSLRFPLAKHLKMNYISSYLLVSKKIDFNKRNDSQKNLRSIELNLIKIKTTPFYVTINFSR